MSSRHPASAEASSWPAPPGPASLASPASSRGQLPGLRHQVPLLHGPGGVRPTDPQPLLELTHSHALKVRGRLPPCKRTRWWWGLAGSRAGGGTRECLRELESLWPPTPAHLEAARCWSSRAGRGRRRSSWLRRWPWRCRPCGRCACTCARRMRQHVNPCAAAWRPSCRGAGPEPYRKASASESPGVCRECWQCSSAQPYNRRPAAHMSSLDAAK